MRKILCRCSSVLDEREDRVAWCKVVGTYGEIEDFYSDQEAGLGLVHEIESCRKPTEDELASYYQRDLKDSVVYWWSNEKPYC